ncbi:hypothetical protein ACFX11_046180 [Malus domestica]
MVEVAYDCLANPLGAVQSTFDKAIALGSVSASISGKDWGAVDLFRSFLYDDGDLSQVPLLSPSAWKQLPQSLLRRSLPSPSRSSSPHLFLSHIFCSQTLFPPKHYKQSSPTTTFPTPSLVVGNGKSERCGASVSDSASMVMAGVKFVELARKTWGSQENGACTSECGWSNNGMVVDSL